MMTHLTTQKTLLLLLDLSQLDGDACQRRAFLDDLRAAARDVGFFYLRGHGVDGALNARLQHAARRRNSRAGSLTGASSSISALNARR